ncbi:MAG TPA: sulfite exporter TauE/SafE family protein [Flavobacterium sp.]|jgi:hypothetical protein|nr:sulfite exporter TauE/SafE family protein [Flavobacterium sp.]
MAEYYAYICALFIGAVLGLTGGGGSILTVPVLVYIIGLNPVVAAAYSLFIVGTTSAFGTIQNYAKGVVDVKTALMFALPSVTAIFLTRKFIVPAIPHEIAAIGTFVITRDMLLMLLFAGVMTFASLSMLLKRPEKDTVDVANKPLLFLKIFAIGVLIGLVGAGGGFMIIPALYLVAKLPMRTAIGTSLCIIALNSLIGFTGDIGHFEIDWIFLMLFSAISVVGISVGIYLNRFFDDAMLRKIFGIFVLAMAAIIFTLEIYKAV